MERRMFIRGASVAAVAAMAMTSEAKAQSSTSICVSVTDFGAVGDGVTDNTASFNKALATSDSVYVPDGIYLITGTVTANDSFELRGNRHTSIILTRASGQVILANYAQYRFEGLTFHAGGANPSLTVSVPFSNSPEHCLSLTNCDFIAVGGVTAPELVLIENVRESYVHGCVFSADVSCANGLYIFNECINISVSACVFNGLFTSSGVSVDGNGTQIGVQGVDFVNCIMIGGQSGLQLKNNTAWVSLVNCQIDNVSSPVIIIGSHQEIRFSNCQFGASTQGGVTGTSVIQMAGAGAIQYLAFVGCSFMQYDSNAYHISNNSSPSTLALNTLMCTNCLFQQAPLVQYQITASTKFLASNNIYSSTVDNWQYVETLPVSSVMNGYGAGLISLTTAPMTATRAGVAHVFVTGFDSGGAAGNLSISASLPGISVKSNTAYGIGAKGFATLALVAGQSSTFSASFISENSGNRVLGVDVMFVPNA